MIRFWLRSTLNRKWHPESAGAVKGQHDVFHKCHDGIGRGSESRMTVLQLSVTHSVRRSAGDEECGRGVVRERDCLPHVSPSPVKNKDVVKHEVHVLSFTHTHVDVTR